MNTSTNFWREQAFDARRERDNLQSQLTATEARLRNTAIEMRVVLNTWLATFAPEFCGEDTVRAAFERIGKAGGTIGFITDTDQKLSTLTAEKKEHSVDCISTEPYTNNPCSCGAEKKEEAE